MISIGMDVHSRNTVVHFFDPEAPEERQHRSVKVPTTAEALTGVLRPLKGRCRVAYEVGTQAQWVAAVVRPLAAEVLVANPSRIPWLYRDGRKNDRLDAKKLATLLYLKQLPTVHLPGADVSAWRALIKHRRGLVKRRTMIKNQIRAMLRAFQRQCPHKSCWTRVGRTWLRSQSFDSARNIMLYGLLAELEGLEAQIGGVERHLDAIAAAQPAVGLLRTIPGIGPRSAEAIVAFVDEIGRFQNRKQFASYFGVTPTQDASGLIDRHGHISKRGPSVVRWVLVEAVHRVILHCPAMRAFFERIWQHRKDRYKKAIVAVARKVLVVSFAMLRDNQRFDASRVLPTAA